MKEKLKLLWLRRPRLSRGQKTARNFILIALLLCWCWGMVGYPLPTNTLNFRRLERINLAAPSEIILKVKDGYSLEDRERDLSASLCRHTVIGLGEDWVASAVGYPGRDGDWYLFLHPRQEGVQVIPAPLNLVSLFDGGNFGFKTCMFLVEVPQSAVRGELTLDIEYRERSYHLDCPLFPMENGVWLVVVEPPENGWSDDWCVGGAYALTLYGADGQTVAEQIGTVPEAM